MSKVSDYQKAESLTGDDITYLIQEETDKKVSLEQIKDFVLKGRELTDVEIKELASKEALVIKNPKW